MTDKTLTRRSILKYLSAATLLSGAITATSVAQAQRVDKKDEHLTFLSPLTQHGHLIVPARAKEIISKCDRRIEPTYR